MSPEIPSSDTLSFKMTLPGSMPGRSSCAGMKIPRDAWKIPPSMALKIDFRIINRWFMVVLEGVVGCVPRVCWSFLRSFGFGRKEEDNKNWRFTLRETFSKNGRISEPQKFWRSNHSSVIPPKIYIKPENYHWKIVFLFQRKYSQVPCQASGVYLAFLSTHLDNITVVKMELGEVWKKYLKPRPNNFEMHDVGPQPSLEKWLCLHWSFPSSAWQSDSDVQQPYATWKIPIKRPFIPGSSRNM